MSLNFKARGLEKAAFRASFAAIFLLDGSRLIGYAGSGFFDLNFLRQLAWAVPVMVIALYLGGKIHTQLTQAAFQRAISILLIVSGIASLLR